MAAAALPQTGRGLHVKILVVTQYFWPEEFRINDLALGLRARGHEVKVLTGLPNYPGGRFFDGYGPAGPRRESHHGIEVRRVPLIPRGRGGALRLALNYLSFAVCASLWAPFVCRDRYDAILVFEPSPVTVGIPARVLRWTTGAPMLFWVQDLWPESLEATGAVRTRWILRSIARLTRFIYRGCDRILIQSRAFLGPVTRVGADPARVAYFPNTCEALYHPVELPPDAPERALLPRGFVVMFAGNIGAAQDFPTILTAARRLRDHPDIHWVVLGDGRLAPWVRAEVERLGLQNNVHMLGRHPVSSMPRFFAAADALLVTLRREPIFALTIPTKIQSYLACARPIVAAVEGEGARIIEEAGAGIVAKPQDAEGLADAVLALHSMPARKRQAMALAGRAYFDEHFARDRLLEQLEGWVVELGGRRADATR